MSLRRREFLILLGGAGLISPSPASAQQRAMPVIGFLHSGAADSFAQPLAAFRKGLSEQGFDEGRNVAIEYRWGENHYNRLPAMAADLVQRKVNVIGTPGSTPASLAAKAATSTIPMVFLIGNDPVRLGLVASLNQPGGNVTGVNFLINALEGKKLALLHELAPAAKTIAVLLNANNPIVEVQARDVEQAAAALGLQVLPLRVGGEKDIDAAFATLVERRAGGLLVTADPSFTSWRERLIAFAAKERVPAVYHVREFPASGGLMSYGTSLTSGFHQVGVYAGRILAGTKPADLPVIQPTQFELVFNLKTAKALGVEVPPKLLFTADEAIE
jgi:putative ABC transport system substrate-binding protein